MQIVRLTQASISFGNDQLLNQVDLHLNFGEKVCLTGRNGTGKSTLLKIISGESTLDSGDLWKKNGLRIGILNQQILLTDQRTVYQVIAEGLVEIGELLAKWHKLSNALDNENLAELEKIQNQLENLDGWKFQQRIDNIIRDLQLDGCTIMEMLSGGMKRKVYLARALVNNPELLLLDEPTNHMDIIMITWLEKYLLRFAGTVLFISHDRAFARRMAGRIIELDRGNLKNWQCDYNVFLQNKMHDAQVESIQVQKFDKKIQQEEIWSKKGIRARRTRNEGRLRTLQAMKEERAMHRKVMGQVQFSLNKADRSGNILFAMEKVNYCHDNTLLLEQVDFVLCRHDRVGLIGANGVGKSTFLKILIGDIVPSSGKVQAGTGVKIAYFDQMREQLDLEKTVIENVTDGQEYVLLNGKKRHVIGYLADFLFSPQRILTPVKALSGGECNRLLLAKLFAKSANLLILDEPTNDLDIETLELLESILLNFDGTLLLVSHDRDFMDNVVTSTLVFSGNGIIKEYVGGFSDWLQQGGKLAILDQDKLLSIHNKSVNLSPKNTKLKKKKLSYSMQRELQLLPDEIEKLENEISELNQKTSDSEFYLQAPETINSALQQLEKLQNLLDEKIERWTYLEEF